MTKKRRRKVFTWADLVTVEETHRIIAALGRSPTGVRNATLVTVLWRAGLRIQEALDLLVRDVDFEAKAFVIRSGKNDVARDVPADRQTLDRVQHWLDVRKPIVGAQTQAVFCTRGAKKVSQSYARRMLREAALQAGIVKKVHPHAFRHLFAGEMQREGKPLAVIARLLGHASTKTTAEYLERCFPDEIRDAIASRPDWAK